jgi:uncharacterized repeat protein (TIGR03803 family)
MKIKTSMKTYIIKLFLLPALIAGLGLIPAGRVTAQTFTTLHSFTAFDTSGINSDGGNPLAGLILSGNTLYGTAASGGSSGQGTVFAVHTNGTGFTNLHSFTYGSDGGTPYAGLILSGTNLYGTTSDGGSSGYGTVFAVNTDGTGFTNLHSFNYSDGAYPQAGLIISRTTLYGTANGGGSSGRGTVFAINTDGTGFTNLHSFTALSGPSTNSDGADPYAGLILSGNTLYGTAADGGNLGGGTVFAINKNGTGFTNLHSFAAVFGPFYTNSGGTAPYAGLILSDNTLTLYGTAGSGGSSGNGTVFKVNINGTGFTTLHSFTATSGSSTNSDGASPNAGLVLSGNTLYGTAQSGGSAGHGTVFAVNTDGTGFATLHNFTGSISDGVRPEAGLILSGNNLYGTAYQGGSSGSGTVFSLFILPQLTILRSVATVDLTWPTNAVGFTLQSTTNLISPAVWSTVAQAPVVINGLNTFFDAISGTRKFYRLSQ